MRVLRDGWHDQCPDDLGSMNWSQRLSAIDGFLYSLSVLPVTGRKEHNG